MFTFSAVLPQYRIEKKTEGRTDGHTRRDRIVRFIP